jgi:hypothetical protein
VLEAPEQDYAPDITVPRRPSVPPIRKLRRDFIEDFAEDFAEEEYVPAKRRRGRVRVKFRGGFRGAGLPGTLCGSGADGTKFSAA